MSASRKRSPLQARDKPPRAGRNWGKIAQYALLSLGSFAGGLLFVFLFLRNARLLVSLGLVGRFYYLTLIPLALSAASFLFGALRSIGIYRGKLFGGVLELGGPVVIFSLVIIGGFYFPPPESNFPLTVYVHGPAGPQDLLLRNQGAVLLDLGGDRRSAPIGDKGQAFFPEVPANFRGQGVNVALDAPGYESSDNSRLELDGTSLYLEVRRKPLRIAGNVIDKTGKPVVGAMVRVDGISTTSVEQGRFDLVVPSNHVLEMIVLHVSADRYETWDQEIIPDGTPVRVELNRKDFT